MYDAPAYHAKRHLKNKGDAHESYIFRPSVFRHIDCRNLRSYLPEPTLAVAVVADNEVRRRSFLDRRRVSSRYRWICSSRKTFTRTRLSGWTSVITGATHRSCFRRCGTSAGWETNPPTSASWGNCETDIPRESILSPYPYKTAKEHYNALLAAAKAKGGPTVYTKANTPDWDGYYQRDAQAITVPSGSGAAAKHRPFSRS
jgi:hypothetical protein